MLKCRKCGAELHPDQKACIACGETTSAGGKFDVEEEQHWRPTDIQIKIAAGVVGLILLILILHKLLYVQPVDEVAKEWFDAMVQRQLAVAKRLSASELEQNLSSQSLDLRGLSDLYVADITGSGGTYTFGQAQFDNPTRPKMADIEVPVKGPTGELLRVVKLHLIKVGRAWRVADAR